jgi:hypothetical protein
MVDTKPRTPFTYTPKSDADLEQLAQDAVAGRVFGTWNVPPGEDLRVVFMVLMFVDKQTIDEMAAANIQWVYEYLDAAGPRSFNGMPSFMSCRYLDESDGNKFRARVDELRANLNGRREQAQTGSA